MLVLAGSLALVLAPGATPKLTNAPALSFACTPAPSDCTGWYTTDVTIRWSWDSTVISVDCPKPVDTISTDTTGKPETCTVSNAAGQATSMTVPIKVDKTPPTVTQAVPDRPPDANGWYNHPLGVEFQGTDATSGIAACTSTGYTGPDATSAQALGTCRDNAGNVSAQQAFRFKYDATAPIVKASGAPLNQAVVLRWTVSPNTRMVAVQRAAISGPRGKHARGARVYVARAKPGTSRRWQDTNLENGVSYVYTLQAVSRAGLKGSTKVELRPTPLFGPQPGARVDAPPRLRWATVSGATYYNVQLLRNGKKVLSVWPSATSLQLHWQWRFDRRRLRFAPGRYQWAVWPGFGSPALAHYGRLLGRSAFVATR